MINTMFPGRPDYTGPTMGVFGLLHHDSLFERSHNVMERVNYVRIYKPVNERAIRLYNMIYLGSCCAAEKHDRIKADYRAKCNPLAADYRAKNDRIKADYRARHEILYADYRAKREILNVDYGAEWYLLDADYWAKHEILNVDADAEYYLLDADYSAKRKLLDDGYTANRDLLDDAILKYIKQHIPDCAWNGDELTFPE